MSAHGHEGHHPRLAHHFDDMDQQRESGTLGMWLFLVTEIMFRPAMASEAEEAAGFRNRDDFEFLDQRNGIQSLTVKRNRNAFLETDNNLPRCLRCRPWVGWQPMMTCCRFSLGAAVRLRVICAREPPIRRFWARCWIS